MKSHWKYSSSVKTFSLIHYSTNSSPARKRRQDPSPRRKLLIQTRSRNPSQRNIPKSLNSLKTSIPEISTSSKHFFSPHIKTYVELSASPVSFDLRGKSIEKDLDCALKFMNYEKRAENNEKIRQEYKKLAKKNISRVQNERKELQELSPDSKKPHPRAAEFFYEVKKGNEEQVYNLLLLFPELVKESDSTGQTALHWAVRRKHLNLVRLMLRNGAGLMNKDIVGRIPEDIAKSKGNEEISEALMLEMKNRRSTRILNQVSAPAARFINQLVSLKTTKLIVNSAALQDHLLRKYCLSGPVRSTSLSTHGRSILKKIPSKDEITKKQVLYQEKLTLAQRLGLISKPDAPLSHEEWSKVEHRSEQREEYKGNCPICHEKQGCQASVILSCSHVFHSACLRSFEKFAKTKACPICRKASYDKKNYKTSENYYYLYCVVKVQSLVRCFIHRERFIRHMLAHPSKHLAVHRKYRAIHMKRLDARLNKHLDDHEDKIDKLFLELENKLQASQAAVFELKNNIRNKPGQRKIDVDWHSVCEKAVARSEKVCPICLQNLGNNRETVILSCSHLFHAKCIESFESYSICASNCPVCRAEYVKKNINDC